MSETNYRALCAELLNEAIYLGSVPSAFPPSPELVDRARALLAQPVAEGPTDEELLEAFDGEFADFFDSSDGFGTTAIPRSEWTKVARAILARWGRPTQRPEGGDIHYAWELHDDEGGWQAGGSAITLESVRREGGHYLQFYSQDGPHTLIIQRVSTIEEVTND
jgi:hypothetical protein